MPAEMRAAGFSAVAQRDSTPRHKTVVALKPAAAPAASSTSASTSASSSSASSSSSSAASASISSSASSSSRRGVLAGAAAAAAALPLLGGPGAARADVLKDVLRGFTRPDVGAQVWRSAAAGGTWRAAAGTRGRRRAASAMVACVCVSHKQCRVRLGWAHRHLRRRWSSCWTRAPRCATSRPSLRPIPTRRRASRRASCGPREGRRRGGQEGRADGRLRGSGAGLPARPTALGQAQRWAGRRARAERPERSDPSGATRAERPERHPSPHSPAQLPSRWPRDGPARALPGRSYAKRLRAVAEAAPVVAAVVTGAADKEATLSEYYGGSAAEGAGVRGAGRAGRQPAETAARRPGGGGAGRAGV
jgi:hypothetical protein